MVPAACGRAACRVALDDIELGESRVTLVAVAQLAWEGGAFQRVLAPDVFARLSRGLSGPRGRHGLIQYCPAHRRVLLEELLQLVGHHAVHQRAHVGVAELCLGLALELRVRQLDRDDGGKALAAVLAGDAFSLLEDVGLAPVGVQHPRQRGLKACFMHAALRRVDIVGEGYQNLIISVVIL